MAKLAILIAPLALVPLPLLAQEPFEGSTLVSPVNSTDTFLVDMDGGVLHTWSGAARPASIAYLFDDGSVLRPCREPGGHFQASGQ